MPYELEDIPGLLEKWRKVAVLTDAAKNPPAVAEALMRHARERDVLPSGLRMYVCEKLSYPDERITGGRPEEIAGRSFSEPNVVIIMREDKSLRKNDPAG